MRRHAPRILSDLQALNLTSRTLGRRQRMRRHAPRKSKFCWRFGISCKRFLQTTWRACESLASVRSRTQSLPNFAHFTYEANHTPQAHKKSKFAGVLANIFNVLGKFISKEKGRYWILFAANRLINHCNSKKGGMAQEGNCITYDR